MKWRVVCVVALTLIPLPLHAQQRTPEVFGYVGRFSAGSDEGGIGIGMSFGGGVTVPVSGRFSVNLDVQTSKVERVSGTDDFYRTKATLIIPSVVYRWTFDEDAYLYFGGGFGADLQNQTTRTDNFASWYTPSPADGWREIRPRVFELDRFGAGYAPSLRTGLVVFFNEQWGIRGEFYTAAWHWGANMGLTYRFN